MDEYKPVGPYFFKSGERAGKTAEYFMFLDYPIILYMLGKMKKPKPEVKNKLHKHLEWLVRQGENREVKKICPQCHDRKIKYFSVLGNDKYGYSFGENYTCCDNNECKQKLISMAGGKTPTLYAVKFSSILKFQIKQDQKLVVRLLRDLFGLPKKITADVAFEFFSK